MRGTISTGNAIALFCVVVLAWGTNWPVTKLVVEVVPPLWTTALRCWIAFTALLVFLLLSSKLVVPRRGDLPVVLSVALLHMVCFSTLVATGLKFIPASKAIVLGYTTPIWVAIGAPLLLGERTSIGQIAGMAMGLLGLGLILNPYALDWADSDVVLGCGLIVLASLFWSASIIYVRSHRWIATPFQLLLWQVLVAAIVLTATATAVEGWLNIVWSRRLVVLLLYGGLVGTALAYWAMSMVNKSLPALTTSLGIMATPLVGIASATIALGETVDLWLVASAALVIAGIACSTLADARLQRRKETN